MTRLPIEGVLPELRHMLARGRTAVLTAPPGSGKTTRVPLALLDEPWLQGRRIVMLEPRRLAARAAAHFMAMTLGEAVGQTVGYRMRLESKIGPTTRIEVVTEGILTRLLQDDPSLAQYAIVIFDEFHERSLHADLGLALCLDAQRLFRPDLRLLVMSATLNGSTVADLLNHAPVIACEGRLFPVDTRYLDRPVSGPLDQEVVRIVQRALKQERGSLLVFLPGMAEIRRVERRLLESHLDPTVLITPLHGNLPQEAQDQAIRPAPPGTRKIVLATSIAETSLTIDGIRVVIDAGFLRTPRFDPRTGLTRLETIRVTQDSAEQRRGRAGRVEPGICYRLWTAAEQQTLAARRPPEILEADLAPMLLELAAWGATDPYVLSWLDPPPAGAVSQAKDLLVRLGALDDQGQITPHGRRMAELALHPRLAHMILNAIPLDLGSLACEVAALLSERDILRPQPGWRNADLRLRLDVLHALQRSGELKEALGEHDLAGLPRISVDQTACQRVQQVAEQWRRQLQIPASWENNPERLGVLLAFAYPDRIAQRQRGSDPRYVLANGRGARFPQPEPLASEAYLVIADLDAGTQWARIDLAAPVSQEELETYCSDQIREVESVWWDERAQAVRARRQRRLGELVLAEQPITHPAPAQITAALLSGVRRKGLASLPWTKELRQWRARVAFLRRVEGPTSSWPDVSDEALLEALERWLGPFLGGVTRLDALQHLDLAGPLQALLTREQRRQLDRLAPTHLVLPSGSRIRLDYEAGDVPVLAVRLQELFGCCETPRVADGKVPVILHLLSPAGRPVQVTQNLASFWTSAYPEVRKELRGRYPKHPWPDNPLSARPTSRTSRRM